MLSHRPLRTALALLLGTALAAPAASAAPASVSADLAAQTGHHTGKAGLDGAVVVRRGSFLRAGIAFDTSATCQDPAMMLTDVASGATLRMPFLDRDEGAALARLSADGLAMRARQRCQAGVLAACGFKQDDASSGGTLFGATLHGAAFGTSVATSEDGTYAIISPYGDLGAPNKADDPAHLEAAKAAQQYAALIGAGAGTPFYTVVVERTYDESKGEVRAALAVWLAEDMPIGAYTLSLGCGQSVVGDGLPLVVLFNPYDATTAEVAPADAAATVQQGRADVIATPGLGSGFALSAPDQAAIDTLLEMIAGYPLAARRHPALVAQIAAKGRGPIQLTGRASYQKAGKAGGYDGGFIGGETNADVMWKAASAWNDATGHFDLWGERLGDVGDGTWPYARAGRIRVRGSVLSCAYATGGACPKGASITRPGGHFLSFQVAGKNPASIKTKGSHLLQDSFASGHTLRIIPPGAMTAAEGVYAAATALLGGIADDVVVTALAAHNGGLVAQVELQGALKSGAEPGFEVIEIEGDIADLFDLLAKPGFGPKLGGLAKGDVQAGGSGKAAGGGAKYGQCWVFSSTLTAAAKTVAGDVKYGQCWVFGSALKGATEGGTTQQALDVFLKSSGPKTNGGPLYTGSPWYPSAAAAQSGDLGAEALDDGSMAYEIVDFSGLQRSTSGVIPHATGLWLWTSGSWSGAGPTQDKGKGKKNGGDKLSDASVMFDGVAYRGVGVWTFDDSVAQDGSVAMSAGFTLPATGHFVDDWQGETAYLAVDAGSAAARVSATSTSGEVQDPLKGIVFHKGGTASYGVDDVKVETLLKTNPDQPTTISGTLLDTGSVFRAYRIGGRGQCHYGKCFCLPGLSEGLLRAAGIPTRSVTNFDSAHEKAGFQIPAGVGPSNAFLLRTTEKAGAGQPWYSFAAYAAYIVANGGDKASIWNFHVWNEAALKAFGEATWNFHVWTEAWVHAAKGKQPSWNAYDSTCQETSDGKVACIDGGFGGLDCGGECSLDLALQAAAKATGVPVDVLGEVLAKPANKPRELLHGRWDGKYGDGKEPGSWDGAAKSTTKDGSATAADAAESAAAAKSE